MVAFPDIQPLLRGLCVPYWGQRPEVQADGVHCLSLVPSPEKVNLLACYRFRVETLYLGFKVTIIKNLFKTKQKPHNSSKLS